MTQHHQDFVESWAAFWAAPDPAEIDSLSGVDIEMKWPGQDQPIRGLEAWRERVTGMLQRFPDLTLTVTSSAGEGDVVFISWRADTTIDGHARSWEGIDRMRMRDGVVADSLVVFDRTGLIAA